MPRAPQQVQQSALRQRPRHPEGHFQGGQLEEPRHRRRAVTKQGRREAHLRGAHSQSGNEGAVSIFSLGVEFENSQKN